jgi:hypothetical protein
MVVYIKKNKASPTNNCVRMDIPPIELRTGPECERELSGNQPPPDSADGYDGYKSIFVGEDPTKPIAPPAKPPFKSSDSCGYHRVIPTDLFKGTTDGSCASPYSRGVLGSGGVNQVIRDREEQLLKTTGKPVVLLRRQFTGPHCPCYNNNRGRSRATCQVCFGTGFTPGYIPFVYEKDPLGRIYVRFEPYPEDTPIKETGTQQEVTISAWTLSYPIIRKRDIIIVFLETGEEEYRYEVKTVTRNDIFNGVQGAQKFTVKRIDPTQVIYDLDPFKVPDLQDLDIDLSAVESDLGTIQADLVNQGLSGVDDGSFANIYVEGIYGDGAFSYLFTEGYKYGYETNFRRVLEFKLPIEIPDFNVDGELLVSDGYGPVFKDSNGKIIRFSTPQQSEDNIGINPLEVLAAEKKKQFLQGWQSGARDGIRDGEIELRARGYQ